MPKNDGHSSDVSHLTYLYLIYDRQDETVIQPWRQFFFEQGLEVLHPDFEGSETEMRESHEENLRNCDAVLIHYGAAGESWLRRKLREVQKSAGYAPTRPIRTVGISPRAAEKLPETVISNSRSNRDPAMGRLLIRSSTPIFA